MRRPECHAGFAACTLLVSLPLLALLFSGVAMTALWGLQHYVVVLSDLELHQEMTFALQQVQANLQAARQVTISSVGRNNSIECQVANAQGKSGCHKYFLNQVDGIVKLVDYDGHHPLTGDHMLASVTMDVFHCRRRSTNLYEI